jgi:hypothetical protein
MSGTAVSTGPVEIRSSSTVGAAQPFLSVPVSSVIDDTTTDE